MFKWRDEFSVNVKSLDEQHKKLLEIGASVYELALLDDGFDHYDEIVAILSELRDYTIYHFETEEKLLKENNCDQLESQQIEHMFFIKKLGKIEVKDFDSQQSEAKTEILSFIANWVSDHIYKSDMNYKDCLNQKGVY